MNPVRSLTIKDASLIKEDGVHWRRYWPLNQPFIHQKYKKSCTLQIQRVVTNKSEEEDDQINTLNVGFVPVPDHSAVGIAELLLQPSMKILSENAQTRVTAGAFHGEYFKKDVPDAILNDLKHFGLVFVSMGSSPSF
ncbi:unnamed protein product [Allacma fusca]|uniref:Uncharacterized protein n=1 Tax=Allacma fusca TaxID=39272 RepID=A0A8J2JXY8_9HEXA|nr:unnamed protein product [Allacma fusca]